MRQTYHKWFIKMKGGLAREIKPVDEHRMDKISHIGETTKRHPDTPGQDLINWTYKFKMISNYD